jgi:hypothetical protein
MSCANWPAPCDCSWCENAHAAHATGGGFIGSRTEADEVRELVEVLCENREAGYINSWWISSGDANAVSSCAIVAVGVDLSTIEGAGETWEAAKNAFADALIVYLERLEPIGSA